jgi:hypothetical protein
MPAGRPEPLAAGVVVPLMMLRRNKDKPEPEAPRRPLLPPDHLEAHEQSLRLQYRAKSSDGIRMAHDDQGPKRLPELMEGIALSTPELIEPVEVDLQDAAPLITRPNEATMWIAAHGRRSPVARHAIQILQLLDAIDLAYETLGVALLYGETDLAGFPRYDAVVGGLISYWDETSGELVVRAAAAWGGEGARADTERMAQRLLARLVANVMASQGALEIGPAERRVASGMGAEPCGHCGFTAVDRRAYYCPKCGMRTARA